MRMHTRVRADPAPEPTDPKARRPERACTGCVLCMCMERRLRGERGMFTGPRSWSLETVSKTGGEGVLVRNYCT